MVTVVSLVVVGFITQLYEMFIMFYYSEKQTYVKGQYGLGGAWHDQGAGYES